MIAIIYTSASALFQCKVTAVAQVVAMFQSKDMLSQFNWYAKEAMCESMYRRYPLKEILVERLHSVTEGRTQQQKAQHDVT